jgi:hypothetical protein
MLLLLIYVCMLKVSTLIMVRWYLATGPSLYCTDMFGHWDLGALSAPSILIVCLFLNTVNICFLRGRIWSVNFHKHTKPVVLNVGCWEVGRPPAV